MRILIVNFGVGGFAGDSGQMLLIAKGLQEIEHEVTIVVTDGDPYSFDKEKSKYYSIIRKKLLDAKGKTVEIDGITVFPIHCYTSKFGLYCPSASKIARKIIKNYDVVYVINWYYHLGMVFAKVAHECNIPFIISAYGSLQEEARRLNKKQKWIADKLYTENVIPHASGLHSVGKLETEEYIKLGADPNKIYRINHGVVLDNFKIKKRTGIVDKIGIRNHKKYLLYIGRIDVKKGIELLLLAFAKLIKKYNNVFLVVAGSGSEDYVKKLKKLISELNIEDFVNFTGFVTEDEKLELLESAKLFVLTSHSDVHPIAVQDALTMGVPVVITESCDFPEVVEYNAGVLVKPDVASIYYGLSKMLENDTILSLLSQNGKKLVEEKFLLEKQIKKYEEMYLNVIKNHNKSIKK